MYKSKRKLPESTNNDERNVRPKVSGPQNIPGQWYEEKTPFKCILNKCGLKMSASADQPCVLTKQSVSFIKSVAAEVKICEEKSAGFIDDIVDGFRRYIKQRDRLEASLMPTQIILTDTENTEIVTDDSLVRLLMKIDHLQKCVASEVLEKLTEILTNPSPDSTLAKLIINQFRFLEHIVDSDALCEKFFSLIKLAKGEIQLEILNCLPELADDSQHENLAANLKDFMENSRELVIPTLDTIGKLSFHSDLLGEIRQTTVSMLNKYNLKDVPVVLKFLFSTAKSAVDVEQLLDEMRGKFNVDRILEPEKGNRISSFEENVTVPFVSVLDTFMKYQKHVLDGAFRYLEKISDFDVMDFILLLFSLNTSKKKSAILLIRQSARSGGLNEELIEKAFKSSLVLKRYFKFIFELSENLLRGVEPAVNNLGCVLYRACFARLNDDFYRQEIIGALVTHVGSGCEIEANSALSTLEILINRYPKEFCQFSIFLKNMLEFLPVLTYNQVRQVFSLLGKLASVDDSDDGCILDDLNIIVRKNISASSLRQRANGVLCAVMLFKNLIRQKTKRNFAIELLEFAKTTTANCCFTRAVLWDELASIIASSELDLLILKKLRSEVGDLFELTYVCSDSEELQNFEEQNLLSFGLNDNQNFAVRVSHLAFCGSDENENGNGSLTALALAPTFRLISTCEMLIAKNLNELQDIFDSNIVFVKGSVIEEFPFQTKATKENGCKSLFHTINWFRELLNAFCSMSRNKNNRRKLIRRLNQIGQLQKDLEKCLQGLTSFAVPVAGYYDKDFIPIIKNPAQQKQQQQKEKREKGRVMRKKTTAEKPTQTQIAASDDGSVESTSPKAGTSKKFPSAPVHDVGIQFYYREFDMSVLDLIECEVSFNHDIKNSEKRDFLLCEDLTLLLEDLSDKLKHAVPSSFKRSAGFLKVASFKSLRFQRLDRLDEIALMSLFSKLIGALFRHLDLCKNYFKKIIDDNDGLIDGPAMWTNQSLAISRCFDLLVSCLSMILSWRGHGHSSNANATKEMMKNVASAISLDDENTLSVNDVINAAIVYFLPYVDFVANLPSANNFLTLLSAFAEYGASNENRNKIAEVALSCLKREWTTNGEDGGGGSLKGSNVNSVIKSLLHVATSNAIGKSSLTAIENVMQTALCDAIADAKFTSETYKTITKTTIGAWYQSLFVQLVNATKKIETAKANSSEEVENSLSLWIQAARMFSFMMTFLKKVEMRTIFNAALQYGNNFVRCFIDKCMKLLDHYFVDSLDNVRRLLSSVQAGTRILQTLCTHSKITKKDATLTKHVPLLKKTLEEFVYRVKAMMAMNNLETALSIAVLKSKNLQGEVLLSQRTLEEDSQETVDSETVVPNSDESEENEAVENASNDNNDYDEEEESEYIEEDVDNEDLDDEKILEMSESY